MSTDLKFAADLEDGDLLDGDTVQDVILLCVHGSDDVLAVEVRLPHETRFYRPDSLLNVGAMA